MLISTSIGVLAMLRAFFMRKRRGEREMSARRPRVKVRVARESPIMVRYWRCQP